MDEVSSEVHDLYFDVDALSREPVDGQVALPLYRGRSRRWLIFESERSPDPKALPPPVGVLTIRSVQSLTVDDLENIGWYSINHVSYDAHESVVVVECNVPLELTLLVSGLDLELIR